MITKITKITLSISSIFLVVMIASGVIFTYLLVDLINQINDKVMQVEISSRERESQGALKVSVANTLAERELLDRYFVPTEGTANFIKSLEALAKENNVLLNIKYVGYEPIKQGNFSATAEAIRFSLDFSGSWANCIQYIKLLESLPTPSVVEKINLFTGGQSVSEKAPKGIIWSASVDFTVAKLKN